MPNKEDMLEPLPEETALQEQEDNDGSPAQNLKDRALDETSKRAQQAMTSPKQNIPETKQAKPPAGKPPTGAVAKGGAENAVSQQATKQATATAARGMLKAAGPIGIALSLASDPRVQKILKYTLMGSIILVGTGVFMLGALAIGGVPNPKKGLSSHVDSKPGSAQVQSVAAKAGAGDAKSTLLLTQFEEGKKKLKEFEGLIESCGSNCPFPLGAKSDLKVKLGEAQIAQENITYLEPNTEQFTEELNKLKAALGEMIRLMGLIVAPAETPPATIYEWYLTPPDVEKYLQVAREGGHPLARPQANERFNALSSQNAPDGKPYRLNGYKFEAESRTKVHALKGGKVSKEAILSDGTYALHIEGSSGDYTVIYSHITSELEIGSAVREGEIIGEVAPQPLGFPNVLIRVLSKDGRWIDWGTEPWRIRPSTNENNTDKTIPGGS
jgi:hypothetical protein